MYTLTIVGGGAMSCGYDSPEDEDILTHTHGALKHPLVKLDSIVETNKQRQKYISEKWGKEFEIYSSLKESISNHKSDIFIVATPTSLHLKIISDILSVYSPRMIICEKPIVSNLLELEKLNVLLDQHKTKIITNFPRRFDPSLNKLKDILSNTSKKYHFYGTFTKGLIHNGSHMIDLVSMLIGNITDIDCINKEIINNDIFGQFKVETETCDGILSNINSDKLSIFELTVYTDVFKVEVIAANQEIKIIYIDKSNLLQGFETYLLKNYLPYTLKRSAYNTFDYAVKLIEDDLEYKKLAFEQYNINKLIFETQKKLME